MLFVCRFYTLKKIVTMGTISLLSLLLLTGCGKKNPATPPEEKIIVTGKIHFRNCDGRIYEAFVDGQSKGAIPENPDPSKCYPYSYGMGMITVVDTFINPGVEWHYHMLDIRYNNIIYDTYELVVSPSEEYYYGYFCIQNFEFAGPDCK